MAKVEWIKFKKLVSLVSLLLHKQTIEAQEKVEALTKQLKSQSSELKALTENYNSERMLRKKYYNMIEDMKGKIRVYCRVRPLSKSELGMVTKLFTVQLDIIHHYHPGMSEYHRESRWVQHQCTELQGIEGVPIWSYLLARPWTGKSVWRHSC